jgi:hypothetical protein
MEEIAFKIMKEIKYSLHLYNWTYEISKEKPEHD